MPEHLDFEIKIDGQPLSTEKALSVLEILVDSSTQLPAMCTIVFHDPDLTLVDDSSLDIGKQLEVNLEGIENYGSVSQTLALALVFKGEITALEPEYQPDSTVLVVRAYDQSHRMHRGRMTRTFLQKKDSDIASTIAGEAGLSASVDATTVTYDYILQNNQTNMEFLRSRAQRIGYRVFAHEGTLYFRKSTWTRPGAAQTLERGTNLISFRPRASAVQQHDKATVVGWDPTKKESINSTKSSPSSTANQGGITDAGGAKAKSAFSQAEAVVTDDPVATVGEADEVAQGLEDRINSEFIQAEGVCLGNPAILPGAVVSITKVGTRFGGSYVATETRHVWSTNQPYKTEFVVSGQQPNTVAALVQGSAGDDGKAMGVVVGIVTNLNDPDDYGRVKVKFPWLPKANGADIESTWCRIAAPMAGPQRGMYFLPEVNDEVLVAFEHGDVRYPYIVGSLWNKTEKPPLAIGDAVASGKVKQRMIKSTSGHVIILDDSQGAEKITIRDKTAKNEIIIDSASNAMTVTVEDALTITAKGAVAIKSTTGDMSLEAKNVNVKAQQNVKVEATSQINLKGTSGATIEGTASVTIKDGAGAQIAMSGPTINMNNGALEVM